MPKCTKCNVEKLVTEFYVDNRSKSDSRRTVCMQCIKLQNKLWRDRNKLHISNYNRTPDRMNKNRIRYGLQNQLDINNHDNIIYEIRDNNS